MHKSHCGFPISRDICTFKTKIMNKKKNDRIPKKMTIEPPIVPYPLKLNRRRGDKM